MKNRVKVTIAALTIGVLAMCGNMTGYATESADAVSTQAAEFTVTYDGNGGEFVISETTYRKTEVGYNSTVTKFDPPNATREDYRFDGWYYKVNGEEKKIEPNTKDVQIRSFEDENGVTLTAGWTQLVTVTVDGKETGTKVAAGNTISVKTASSNTLNLDKWVVNASDANNEWELKPNNNEGTIKVEPAVAEKHVIYIDGEKTGFGITSKNPKANFVSYWSPQNGYLVQVKNETGHPLKFSKGGTLNDQETSKPEFFEIITELPKKTDDEYFTILNPSIMDHVTNKEGEYVNHVKVYDLTLNASDVQRNIKISFKSQTDVTYTNTNLEMALPTNNCLLTPQELLGTASATREGFEKYRWSYSVKDSNDKWISADKISENAWSADPTADILNKKFNYSFPYYEFKFEPVWQCQIDFETGFPTTETEGVPEKPASLEQDEDSTFADFQELKDSKGRYRFKGWKLKGDTGDILYTNKTEYKVTSPSVTFVGQWEAISYPIYWTFENNEGRPTESSILYGQKIIFPENPTRTGYTFLGWMMSVGDASTDNGVKTSEKLYKAGDEVMMPAGAVTMTAQWKINTYTVTYDGNGGTIGIYTGRDDVAYNASYEIKNVSGITPTRYGYKFLGWKINGSGDTLQAGSSFTMPAKNVELVAQWEGKSPNLGNKGKHDLSNGVCYTYNGTFRIKGDPSNYQDKITFYVPKAGEYTFE